MNGISETDMKRAIDQDPDISYIRFDPQSNNSTTSTIVLSSCSSDEENDDKHAAPTLGWKRQKILNNDYLNTSIECVPSASETLNSMHLDPAFVMSAKENVGMVLDEELRPMPPRRLPPIPADKLHRRNPHTVRQEIKKFDDVIPETTLTDVQLNEMPGLHNTEQWKRIAGRTVHASPPLSRQYYQTMISTQELQNGQIPHPLISYRRPGRSENEQDLPTTPNTRTRAPRRRVFIGSSVVAILVAIVVAVVLAVTLVQKTGQTTTNYYSGSVYVRALFDPALFDLSSTKARDYKREFCSLIGTTFADAKTKYALWYTTCSVTGFRNGSIYADFVLGFTQSQNVTRLNFYLNRTLVDKTLFGGQILTIYLNTTLCSNNSSNSTDSGEDNDYNDGDNSENSGKFVMTDQHSSNEQQEPSRTTYTTVTYTKLDTVPSTLEDLTTQNSTTVSSSSTLSLNDQTILNSTSILVNNRPLSTNETPASLLTTTNSRDTKWKDENSDEKYPYSTRPNVNSIKRQRRMVLSKNHRRLLQYELMPTGKVYYVDRPFYKDSHQGEQEENSSAILSTILSRSSSLDTLSEKHSRHRRHPEQQQQKQQNPQIYQDLSLKKSEQKVSIGGRLASNNNLPSASSTFKPINTNKKKRFSSFEPTPESLDRVFDVLIAADKRREEHEFWKEKFDQRPANSRVMSGSNRLSSEPANANTIPILRSKQTQLNPKSLSINSDHRSQSYTTKRTSSYEPFNQPSGCLLENCLRKRAQLLEQQRNYSPNAIYSTNYPKQQQLFPTTKPPIPTAATTTQQPVRILPLSNGRIGRAPQARQTSDELSSISEVWAARSSVEDPSRQPKKTLGHARFQSTINRNRLTESKPILNKRAASVEQDKSTRTQTKNLSTAKNKFFDLFKFHR